MGPRSGFAEFGSTPARTASFKDPLRLIARGVDEYHYSVGGMWGRRGEPVRCLWAVQKAPHSVDWLLGVGG